MYIYIQYKLNHITHTESMYICACMKCKRVYMCMCLCAGVMPLEFLESRHRALLSSKQLNSRVSRTQCVAHQRNPNIEAGSTAPIAYFSLQSQNVHQPLNVIPKGINRLLACCGTRDERGHIFLDRSALHDPSPLRLEGWFCVKLLLRWYGLHHTIYRTIYTIVNITYYRVIQL